MTKRAIGNLVNRYRAVLKKCRLLNVFGSLLLAGGGIFGMAQTAKAQVVLEQKNIHFRENYSKEYADNVTIKLTSTGTTSQQNYSQENFTPNEGTASAEEPGIGIVLWEQVSLILKKICPSLLSQLTLKAVK